MSITITRTSATTQGYTEALTDAIGIPMIFIPGGTFRMGSPDDEPQRGSSESPQHDVSLTAFCMGQFPVTQAQWRIVAAWESL
jgi:formylglycine-generating enzyme required for sulfatase activity